MPTHQRSLCVPGSKCRRVQYCFGFGTRCFGDKSGYDFCFQIRSIAFYAFENLKKFWFADGLTTAHRKPLPSYYRGPNRLLQMLLICFKKCFMPPTSSEKFQRSRSKLIFSLLFSETDELLRFETSCQAGVWLYRDRNWSFQLPFVGSFAE
jgi:hypothetical protein